MYCTKCELEIKGEEKTTCPICDSPLIENPFDDSLKLDEGSTEDDKLDELIENIDKTVDLKLEDTDKTNEIKLEEEELELLDNEFKLELEDQKDGLRIDSSEDQMFDLNSEDEKADGEIAFNEEANGVLTPEKTEVEEVIKELKEEIEEDSGGTSDLNIDDNIAEDRKDDFEREELQPEKLDNESDDDNKIDLADQISTAIEKDEELEAAKSTIKTESNDEEISTQEILDKALDELDSTDDDKLSYEEKHSTRNWSVVIGVFVLLAVFVGGGVYYLKYKSGSFTYNKPVLKVAAKEDEVLKKLLKRDEVKKAAKADAAQPQKKSLTKTLVQLSPRADISPEKTPKTKVTPQERELQVERLKSVAEKRTKPPKKTDEKVKKSLEKKTVTIPPVTYVIHAGSFKNRRTAEGEAKRFKNKGFQSYVERTDLTKSGKGIWYRIKIGSFSTRKAAEIEQKKLHSKFKVQSRIIKNKK